MQKIVDWMLAGIRRIPTALDSFIAHMNCHSLLFVINYLNFATFSKDLCYGFSLLSTARRGAQLVDALRYGWINMLCDYGLNLTVSVDCFLNVAIYGRLPQKVHYHLHEGIQVGVVLSQMNQTHMVSSYIFEHPF